MMKKSDCDNPSVENCLNCPRKECTCKLGTKLHESEINALLNAGMIDRRAINAFNRHRKRKGDEKE